MNRPEWHEQASCAGHPDPELWWSDTRSADGRVRALEAISVCTTCPVRVECLTHGLTQPGGAWGGGIWGGLTEPQLDTARKQRGLKAPRGCRSPHGTEARYAAHKRDGDEPCEPCRLAAQDAQRERKRRWRNKQQVAS